MNNNLPTIATDRLLQGDLIKCVDGNWRLRDGTEMTGATMLAIGTTEALQCWRNQTVLDTIIRRPDELLPDVNELNAKIPQAEWETGLDGQPKPPWQNIFLADL